MGARAIVTVARVAAIAIVRARRAETGLSRRNRRIVRARERKVATVATIVRSRKHGAMLLQPNARQPRLSPNRSHVTRLLPSSVRPCRILPPRLEEIVRHAQKVLLQMVNVLSVVVAAVAVAAVVAEVVVKKAPVDRARRAVSSRKPTIGHSMGHPVRRKVAVKTPLRGRAPWSSPSEVSICPRLPRRKAPSTRVHANTKKERRRHLLPSRLKVRRSPRAIRRSSGRPVHRLHRVRGVVRALRGATSEFRAVNVRGAVLLA
jgi:hypothetical protein